MKKVLAIVLTLIFALSMLTACGGGSNNAASAPPTGESAQAPAGGGAADAAPSGEAAPAGSAKTYAIILKSTGNPYMDRLAAGFSDACKEFGADVIIKAPANPMPEDQIAMIEELIVQEVDGIVIAANDPDALQNALKKAMNAGIAVVGTDSSPNAASRQTFANQADTVQIGKTLVAAAYDLCGGEGQFAILSATSQATNQNAWIAEMEKELQDPKYANLELVKIAYGDDLPDKSTSETQGLLQSYPELKCIVAPTTVGIAAAAKVVTDQGISDKVKITGLGLPSEMAEYIDNGACPYMYLWNPVELGYLSGYTLEAIASGSVTGAAGDAYSAGKLGNYTVVSAADGGTEVLLGPPFKFDPSNIADWKTVY